MAEEAVLVSRTHFIISPVFDPPGGSNLLRDARRPDAIQLKPSRFWARSRASEVEVS